VDVPQVRRPRHQPRRLHAEHAGVGGGELGFGGSVSLTLRGSDLVGAINRTNTTISRVG
jgi:hypothetical protein